MAEEKFEREKLLETALQQVAGQLKSSLGNIHGALERIVPPDARDADAGLDMNAAVLTRSYYRILRLANNLSDLAGAGGEISSRRINDDIVGFCREILRKAELPAQLLGLELEFRCEKSSHIIAMDADRLERMLLNLLSNAFKFTSRGGKVTLEVEIGLKEVLLRLTDTGCGMTEEELASAFERYLRTQPLPPPCGLGLGLPLSRGIAREHGGELTVTARPGEGTAVTVSLPNRKSGIVQLRTAVIDYSGGFNPVLVELADALPKEAFAQKYLD